LAGIVPDGFVLQSGADSPVFVSGRSAGFFSVRNGQNRIPAQASAGPFRECGLLGETRSLQICWTCRFNGYQEADKREKKGILSI